MSNKFRKIAAVVVGYLAACVVSSSLPLLSEMAASGGKVEFGGVLEIYFAAIIITFIFAMPGFAISLLAARRTGINGPFFFMTAGSLNAVIALAISSISGLWRIVPVGFGMWCVIGGCVGGLTFWSISRLIIGRSRQNSLKGAATVLQ